MAYVEGKLGEEIKELMDESNEKYDEEQYLASIELLEKAWGKLPGDKNQYDESFLIVWGILETAIQIKNTEKMKEWVDKVFEADPERGDTGEREMWAGRVAFECGNKEEAKRYFELANQKSNGRCFGNNDKVYKDFFLNS